MTALRTYFCNNCETVFDFTHHPNIIDDPVPGCPDCESADFRDHVGNARKPVTIVSGNSDFAQRQRERLSKRSNDHYKSHDHDDAMDRQQAQFKREGIIE